MSEYYAQSVEQTSESLRSSHQGLSHQEIKKRLEQCGKNELTQKKRISPIIIFFRQFQSPLIYILIAALLISAFLGELSDSIVIFAILIFIGIFGFIQEYKAERSLDALKKLVALKSTVIREGREQIVETSDLVPGDVILIETGDKVPADARLIEVRNLSTQESSLTGESEPITKSNSIRKRNTPLAERTNMVFSGTIVTSGKGRAIVVATGMNTEIGKIAEMIENVPEEQTHLQKKLEKLGKKMTIAVLLVSVIVFLIGIFRGGSLIDMFLISMTLAVAAVPEGLPAVVTISLALAVRKMATKNALVRTLPSVETLGSTTVICSDKTGTLTKNEMTVEKLYVNGKVIDVTGTGYATKGEFLHDGKKMNVKEYEFLLSIGALCNDAKVVSETVIGDPTEGCLIVSAEKAGLKKEILDQKFSRIGELEFTSERKRMSTIHIQRKKKILYCKGAPDVILHLCSKQQIRGKIVPLTKKRKEEILKRNHEFASKGLRVLGFAYKDSGILHEKEMIFVGLQGMMDPPRDEAKKAIEKCVKAGIRVIMITGDHEVTAQTIGNNLGITGEILTGKQIDQLRDLSSVLDKVSIFARVDPQHKIQIVQGLKDKGHIVAMTGDGVNDAPALKDADIGISMGITGTDVSKEASDIILLDDNFASIVNAIEEGRGVYDNIKKFVNYLLSSNFGEVLIIFFAMVIGFQDPHMFTAVVPLLPIHLLWINLVTDGLPAIALGIDPTPASVMERKPRDPQEEIISLNMGLNIIIIGILMTFCTLFLF